MREEIEVLREALARAQSGGGGVSDDKVAEMEEMIANLERAKQSVRR